MESQIDERYRLKLLEYYLDNVKEMMLYGGAGKWVFVCPFCGSLGRTEGKKLIKRDHCYGMLNSTPGYSPVRRKAVWIA